MLGFSGLHSGVPLQPEVEMLAVSSSMRQESKRPRQLCQGLAWSRPCRPRRVISSVVVQALSIGWMVFCGCDSYISPHTFPHTQTLSLHTFSTYKCVYVTLNSTHTYCTFLKKYVKLCAAYIRVCMQNGHRHLLTYTCMNITG